MTKKNSSLTKKEFIKNLKEFLGFTKAKENSVNENTLQLNLAEKFTLDSAKKKELFQIIKDKTENLPNSNELENKIKETTKNNQNYNQLNTSIASSLVRGFMNKLISPQGMTFVFAAGLLFGFFVSNVKLFNTKNEVLNTSKAEKLFVYSDNTTKLVNLTTNEKGYSNKKYSSGQYGKKLHFWARDLTGLKIVSKEKITHVYFKMGKVLFKYKNKNTENKLFIHIPTRIIEVVGTEFMVDLRKNKSTVIVKKGKIKILKNSKEYVFVEKNEIWKSNFYKPFKLKNKTSKRIFSKFKNAKIKNKKIFKLFKKLKYSGKLSSKKKSKQDGLSNKSKNNFSKNKNVIVYMNNGEKISGKIISSGKEKIWLQTDIVDSLEIPRSKIEKIEYQ